MVTFVVGFMTQKGHGVIRGRRDLLFDPKGHRDLYDRFDLVYDPKITVKGSYEINVTPKVNLTFDLDLRVKHLNCQLTTLVQAILYCEKAVAAFNTFRVCNPIMLIFSYADNSTP